MHLNGRSLASPALTHPQSTRMSKVLCCTPTPRLSVASKNINTGIAVEATSTNQ